MKAVRVLASGRVQGVGFRQATVREVSKAGLAGWVRNLPDGRVEAWLQGDAAAVGSVLGWLRRGGPPRGRVDALDETPVAPDPLLGDFDVRW